jgi:4-diphosphocytidyl-2-C-methyl-D-erythritol kinase
MILKSFAKINLSLNINKKLKNGLHDLQSYYCLINLHDTIHIRKNFKNNDKITFEGPYSKLVKNSNNSIKRILNELRKNNLISNFYTVKIIKKIPVYAGLGGGSSNAASILNFFNKKINKKILNNIIFKVGSDLRLFFYKQGYLKNINTVVKYKNKHKFYFLVIFPNVKCSSKEIYSYVKKRSKKKNFSHKYLKTKKNFIHYILNAKNDLQSIVEKKYPLISKLLIEINNENGCILSRMTGSGSACFGLFTDKKCSKVALKSLKKKYPKFWFSIAKTI